MQTATRVRDRHGVRIRSMRRKICCLNAERRHLQWRERTSEGLTDLLSFGNNQDRLIGATRFMRIRLTRKFAQIINGIDLSRCHIGDVLDPPTRAAKMLIAEGWAEAARSSESSTHKAEVRPAAKKTKSTLRRPPK